MFVRAFDTAMFATGAAYVLWWGWPSTIWGWGWLLSAVLPLTSWFVWGRIRAFTDARAVRRTMAYRRQKFGGFVSVPGERRPIPVERPQP